jgi:type II secretory pathway pseudopilin PulG
LSEYISKRVVVQDVPAGSRPIVETRYDSVASERRGKSGVAVAALVVAGITAAVVITMMIMNSQQRNSEDAMARERARTAEAQQALAQQPQQPPVIVNMPPAQPATATYPVVGPSESAPVFTRLAPSNASVEIDVTSRLQNDELLRPYAIDVNFIGGIATLSGNVPDEDLKKRAEKLTKVVKAVQSVVNDIAVKP